MGDDADHDLSAVDAVADKDMTDESFSCRFVVGRDIMSLHPAQDGLQNLLVFGASDAAVRHGNHGVGMACIEAGQGTVFTLLYGNLFLISVVPGFVHADNGAHDCVNFFRRKAADPDQVLPDFFLFEGQLFYVVQSLDLAAAAGSGNGTAWFHTGGRRLQDAVQMAVGIAGSHLGDRHFYRIAGYRVFDKNSKAFFCRLLLAALCSCSCCINAFCFLSI